MRIRQGTTMLIPLGNGSAVGAQVIARYHRDGYFVAVFAGEFSLAEPPIPADAVSGETILVGLTFDAKISNGDWPMLGDAPVREDVPLPAYKVAIGHPEKIEIEDYSGTRSRPATTSELGTVPHRMLVSPMLLELGAKAHYGLAHSLPHLADLVPNEDTSSQRLFSA
jgi:hypothetical protein